MKSDVQTLSKAEHESLVFSMFFDFVWSMLHYPSKAKQKGLPHLPLVAALAGSILQALRMKASRKSTRQRFSCLLSGLHGNRVS
jgi:hypothetical protein